MLANMRSFKACLPTGLMSDPVDFGSGGGGGGGADSRLELDLGLGGITW